jgi:DNA ligase 4
LENKGEVCRFNVKPRFRIIDIVGRHGISKENILHLNRHGYCERVQFAKSIPEFEVGFDHGRQLQPSELFKRPFTVELMGAGFDKPANARYFALRFPRVLKVHEDRSFRDTVSFEELQEMARRCGEVPEDGESEDVHWLTRLRNFDYQVEASRSGSPSDDFNPAAVTGTTGIDNYCAALEVEKKAEIGLGPSGDISPCSSKRKMPSGISPQGDLATKRAKQEGRE